MPVTSFDSSSNYNNFNDGGNISISKKMHIRTIDAKKDALATDQIEKSSSSYQETHIPAADSPELGSMNPHADKSQPRSAPSPQNAFMQKVHNQIANLTPGQLATLGNGVSKEQAQGQLLFALNHPGVPVDPDVQNLLNEFTQTALTQTQKQFNLPSAWQPEPPNTEEADKQLSQAANRNFENLAHSELPTGQANKLIFQYYHPEFSDPSDQALFNKLKGQSNGEIAKDGGLPDGWQTQPDSFEYDSKLDSFNDAAFEHHLNSNPETQHLSKKEKAKLKTLHHFPEADVPGKDKLKKHLAQLEHNARNDTAQKFSLPGGFKPGTTSEDYAANILGEFGTKFAQAAKNIKPPLSQAQLMKLLGSGGTNPKNLPPELQALFNQLQGKTADDIAELFGLPKNWLNTAQAKKTEGTPLMEEGENPEESKGTQGADNSIGTAFPEVMRKQLRKKNAAADVGGTEKTNLGRRDYQAALNAIDLYQNGYQIFGQYTNELQKHSGGLLSNDWLNCGEFTFAVTKSLDKLRNEVYQVQYAEANMSKQTSQMQTDNQRTQNLISEQKMQNEQAQQQQSNQKNVFACFENIPGPLGVLAKMAEAWIKTVFWVLDTVLGGALSAICQACGCQPLGENPLEQMGLITPAQAAEMDKDLQIIVQVVEIVVEILMAQPELIAASIASIAQDVAEVAVDVVIQTVVKSLVKEVVVEGGEMASEAAVKTAVKDTIKSVVEKLVSKVGKFMSKSGREALEKSVKEAMEKNLDKIAKTATEKAEELIKDPATAVSKAAKGFNKATEKAIDLESKMNKTGLLKQTLKKGFKEAGKELRDAAKEIGQSSAKELGEKAKNFANAAGKLTKQELKEAAENAKSVLKMTAKDARDKIYNIGNSIRRGAHKTMKGFSKVSDFVGHKAGNKLFLKMADKIGKRVEDEGDIIKGTAKMAREARVADATGMTSKLNRGYQLASFVRDTAQGSMQVAANTINGMKDLKLAQLRLERGELDAAMATLDADLQVMKKTEQAILDTLSNLAGWINDINKQENDFFRKAQIHFISA